MATFPSISPSYQASKTTTPNINVTQFNDGYQHRIKFGLNTIPYVWSLSFDVSEADSDVIEAFLEARALDGASFDWSPPDESTTYKWICPSFTKEVFSFDRNRISATFTQVFEP